MPPFVKPVVNTPPYKADAALKYGGNISATALKNGGLAVHNAYVDRAFLREYVTDRQVIDTDELGFTTVTTVAQAIKVGNALRPLIIAHLADAVYAHLAADTTSAAITAPIVDSNGTGNVTQIGTGNAGLKYTPNQSGVTVEHSGGVTQALTIGVTGKAIKVNLAGTGTATDKGAGNAGVKYTANQSGVTVAHADPGADAGAEVVTVSMKAITVTLRRAMGVVTSTADQVRAAVAGSAAAMALLAAVANTGDGTGTVVVAGATALTWAQTSTAENVRAAVAGSAAAMALLTAVANAGDGTGTVAVAAVTPLDGSGAIKTLLNQEKATVNTHFARQPEHNPLPASPPQIAAADATDDASTIALADELLKDWQVHVKSAAVNTELVSNSP